MGECEYIIAMIVRSHHLPVITRHAHIHVHSIACPSFKGNPTHIILLHKLHHIRFTTQAIKTLTQHEGLSHPRCCHRNSRPCHRLAPKHYVYSCHHHQPDCHRHDGVLVGVPPQPDDLHTYPHAYCEHPHSRGTHKHGRARLPWCCCLEQRRQGCPCWCWL